MTDWQERSSSTGRRGVHYHRAGLPNRLGRAKKNREEGEHGEGSGLVGDGLGTSYDDAISSSNTARPLGSLHGTDRVGHITFERLKLHTPGLAGGFKLSEKPRDKPFSVKTAQYWSLPHGWGQKHSQHWSHPGRNWGFPDVAAMGRQDEGFAEDEGRLVAFVEWDCGACGDLPLFECPHGTAVLQTLSF